MTDTLTDTEPFVAPNVLASGVYTRALNSLLEVSDVLWANFRIPLNREYALGDINPTRFRELEKFWRTCLDVRDRMHRRVARYRNDACDISRQLAYPIADAAHRNLGEQWRDACVDYTVDIVRTVNPSAGMPRPDDTFGIAVLKALMERQQESVSNCHPFSAAKFIREGRVDASRADEVPAILDELARKRWIDRSSSGHTYNTRVLPIAPFVIISEL